MEKKTIVAGISFKKMPPAKKVALLGILTATAAALSFLEGLIPPLPFLPPGAKAGFSNIITMYAAMYTGLVPALTIAFLKSLFVLALRGATAFFMSVAGGLISTLVMWIIIRCGRGKFGYIGIGIAGAAAHNTTQLMVSMLITCTPQIVTYLPVLLIFSCFSGTVTGMLLKAVIPAAKKILQ